MNSRRRFDWGILIDVAAYGLLVLGAVAFASWGLFQ